LYLREPKNGIASVYGAAGKKMQGDVKGGGGFGRVGGNFLKEVSPHAPLKNF
jgi:hypothetical protein